jgi:hypothetical protein
MGGWTVVAAADADSPPLLIYPGIPPATGAVVKELISAHSSRLIIAGLIFPLRASRNTNN